MNPLTATEKAYFDTIKSVTRSARPADLGLHRMTLDGKEVAVVVESVYSSESAEFVGYLPLAIICDEEMAAGLRDVEGRESMRVAPEGLEGASS